MEFYNTIEMVIFIPLDLQCISSLANDEIAKVNNLVDPKLSHLHGFNDNFNLN